MQCRDRRKNRIPFMARSMLARHEGGWARRTRGFRSAAMSPTALQNPPECPAARRTRLRRHGFEPTRCAGIQTSRCRRRGGGGGVRGPERGGGDVPSERQVAASSGSAGEIALGLVGKAGRVILVASTRPPESLQVPWNLLHDREVALEGSVGNTAVDFHAAVALISNGSVDLKPLVSRVIPLSELAAGTTPHAGRHGAARRSPASGPVRMTG